MRRFLCAVCLVALLAGCAPASSTVSSEPQSAPEPQSETADAGELKAFCPITPAGYFYTSYKNSYDSRLTVVDPETATGHFACSIPGCDHANDSCEAWVTAMSVWVLDDAIYTLAQNEDGSRSLSVRDSDGTHPRPLATVGDWIFYGADSESLYGICGDSFGRVSRTDGTETFLLHDAQEKFSDQNSDILGIWQDSFVAARWYGVPGHPDSTCLYLLNREGQLTEVARIDSPGLWYDSCILAGDEVVYIDEPTGKVMAVSLADGSSRLVTDQLCSRNIVHENKYYSSANWTLAAVQDQIIVRVVDIPEEKPIENAYRVNPDGSVTELPPHVELRGDVPDGTWPPTDTVSVVAQRDDLLVVIPAWEYIDGGVFDNSAFISAEDYLAGRDNYREFILPE